MPKKQNLERTKTIPILKFSLEKFYEDGFYYKPPDTFVKNKVGKKPFDILFSFDEFTIGIEAKYIGNRTFVFSEVQEHQVENLINIAKNGSGYIAVHYKNNRQEQIAFLGIWDFLHLRETYHKKSMRWEEVLKDDHFVFVLDVESYDVAPGQYKKFINLYGTYLMDEE